MKKVGSTYKTDYYTLVYSTIDDYGEIFLNLGSQDIDSNGLDDLCEKDKSAFINVNGNWYSQTGSSGTITGSLSKTTGSQYGQYNLSINNTVAGNIPISGSYYVGSLAGSVLYNTETK